MHLAMLLQMASDGMPDRVAFGPLEGGVTMPDLAARAQRVAAYLTSRNAERLAIECLHGNNGTGTHGRLSSRRIGALRAPFTLSR